jgi:UTP:GlnB (protein PII) uridylyltransferase
MLPRAATKTAAEASATLETGGQWVAEGRLRVLSSHTRAEDLPYLEWASSPTPRVSVAPALRAYRLEDDADRPGGVLCMVIEADDVLGLLGNLIEAVRALGLWPEELHIDTREGRAHDRFWLTTAQGLGPSQETREALVRWLQGQLARETPR